MITVLHLITGLDTGGAEMMLYKLVAHSDRQRFRHVVVSLLEVGTIGKRIEEIGIPVHTLHMHRGRANPLALVRLLAALRNTNPDILQTWLYHSDLLGWMAASLMQVPLIWNIRTSFHRDLGLTVAVVAKLCARLSYFPAAVVTNSEAARELHTELGYRPKEWLSIPNGFEIDRFGPSAAARQIVRQELGLPSDAILIGLIARYHPQKDHRTFLRAASLLIQNRPEVHFVLVGQGVTADNASLRESIGVTGLQDQLHLLGERKDTPTLNAAFDIATCSSAFGESFPNVVGEAMACAVPCVVTDVGDAAHVVGDTGLVVPPQNALALAAAWQKLLDLGLNGRIELGQKARVRVEEAYRLDMVVRQYEALYERIALKSKRRHSFARVLDT